MISVVKHWNKDIQRGRSLHLWRSSESDSTLPDQPALSRSVLIRGLGLGHLQRKPQLFSAFV